MAEVRTVTNSGEVAQRFIEFVMMQAQHAALFLGQIPNPQSGKAEVNLEMAKMFIDQLAMIQEKTRGNLSSEEGTVLRNTKVIQLPNTWPLSILSALARFIVEECLSDHHALREQTFERLLKLNHSEITHHLGPETRIN